jgi:hypothetical protein
MSAPSEKYVEAAAELPAELRDLFDMLVEMYRYSSAVTSGWSIVYYKVIAELTRQMAGNEKLLDCLTKLRGTEYHGQA